jgi:hypothetical protein
MSDTGVPPTPPLGAPKEPLLTVGALIALITATLGLAVSFGFRVTDAQQSAILAVLAVLAPFIVALVGRVKVWSPATVRAALLAARAPAAKRTMPHTRTDPGLGADGIIAPRGES